MRHPPWLLVVAFGAAACGSPIPSQQPDGRDCNYAEAATACGPRSFCDPGPPLGNRGFARKHIWGLFGAKMHVVGTCRTKAAAHHPCNGSTDCISGRCIHPTPNTPGVCE